MNSREIYLKILTKRKATMEKPLPKYQSEFESEQIDDILDYSELIDMVYRIIDSK